MSVAIQEIILGKGTKIVNDPQQIFDLFRQGVNPEILYILHQGLNEKKIDPNVAMTTLITYLKDSNSIVPISFCLKSGADPNLYVQTENIGNIHIIAYVINTIEDLSLATVIIIMLLVAGSVPSQTVFLGGPDENVIQWATRNEKESVLKKITIGDPQLIKEKIEPESVNKIAIVMDRPVLLNDKPDSKDISLAIKSFSEKTLKILTKEDRLYESLLHYNKEAFVYFLSLGHMLSYDRINNLILMMRDAQTTKQPLIYLALEEMLLLAISDGMTLDFEQRNILSTLGKNTLEKVNREYAQPYWRKVCRYPKTQLPFHLKRLALALSIDTEEDTAIVCKKMKDIAEADSDQLKEAARRRQEKRLVANLGYNNEFIGSQEPNLVCRNTNLLSGDPMNNSDLELSYYRDEAGAVWCFTSEMYDDLLERKRNPYNNTALNNRFLSEVQLKNDLLHRLGLRNRLTLAEGLDQLKKPDSINDHQTMDVLRNFQDLAIKNGFTTPSIEELKTEQLEIAFDKVNYRVRLKPLTRKHAIITAAHITTENPLFDDQRNGSFFSSLSGAVYL